MEFRLTYAGRVHAHRDDKRLEDRSLRVHEIRREFHKQLRVLWDRHPVMGEVRQHGASVNLYVGGGAPPLNTIFRHDGFDWLPIATEANGLVCGLDVLMLRKGPPGRALFDIDNRLKTVFDALRKARSPNELGSGTSSGQVVPGPDETPFYVLLENDHLITRVSVTADDLLESVPDVPDEDAVRLILTVSIRPYQVFIDTIGFA